MTEKAVPRYLVHPIFTDNSADNLAFERGEVDVRPDRQHGCTAPGDRALLIVHAVMAV